MTVGNPAGFGRGRSQIAIIGCGPAGTTVARHARKGDRDIILFERGEEPESACSGGLTAPLLERIGWIPPEGAIQQSFTTARLHSKNYTATIRAEDLGLSELGVIVDRSKFDQYLLREVRDDVDLHMNTSVMNLERDKGWVIHTDKDTYKSKIVILCNGAVPCFPHQTPLAPRDMAVGVEDRIKGTVDTADLYLEKKYANVGYAWVFPAGNMVKIGLGETESEGKDLRSKLEVFKRDTGFDEPAQERISGTIPLSKPIDNLSPEGNLALAGDAGRLCNPLTGGGIANAICSGRVLGKTLARGEPLGRYDERMQGLKIELSRIYLMKKLLYGLTDSGLDKIIRGIDSTDFKSTSPRRELIRLSVKTIIHHPELMIRIMMNLIH